MSQAVPEDAGAQMAFQAEIDAISPGSQRKLTAKEFAGPVLLRSPIELDGNNSTIWALEGPVVKVCSPGVRLKNLRIEVTGDLDELVDPASCAIEVHKGADVELEDVEVRGNIIGVAGEEGHWVYPSSLHLGWIEPQKDVTFLIKIAVPFDCKLMSEISGLDVKPHGLSAGVNTVLLELEGLARDTLLTGTLVLQTSRCKRRIVVTGHACPNDGVARKVALDGELLWSCPLTESAVPPPPSFPMEPASVPVNSQSTADKNAPTTDSQPSSTGLPPEPRPASIPGHISLPVEAHAALPTKPPVTPGASAAPALEPTPNASTAASPASGIGDAGQELTSVEPVQSEPSSVSPVAPVQATPPPASLPTTNRTPKFKRPGTSFPSENPFSVSTPITGPTETLPTPSKATTTVNPLFTGSEPIISPENTSGQPESSPHTDDKVQPQPREASEQTAKKPVQKLSPVFLPKKDDP